MPTAWEVDTAVYEDKYKNVTPQGNKLYSMFLSPDGFKMYTIDDGVNKVFQYTLSTAWDVTTAVYADKYISLTLGDKELRDLSFKSDGTKMYIVDYFNRIWQYGLSTAWDVTTAVYEGKYLDTSARGTYVVGVFFRTDGNKMYFMGGNDRVHQYALSTPWEIETATYENKLINVNPEDSFPMDVFFKPDGCKMYIMGYTNDKVIQYILSTPWDVSTAAYEEKFKSVVDQDGSPRGLFFKPDGTEFYVAGDATDNVYQYSLPEAEPEGQPLALRRRDRYIGGVVR